MERSMLGTDNQLKVSVVLPALNEGAVIGWVVEAIRDFRPDAEIVVVDDGSMDATSLQAVAAGASVVRHPYSMGNGAAVKSGARVAQGNILVFMDADGQHDPAEIPQLLARLEEGFDMVVGARSGQGQASAGRSVANRIYNRLATWLTGHSVLDLTSGFRAVRAERFKEFLYLLPNGFSYPTTITMAFFRAGYPVAYEAISPGKRQGRESHIRPLRDGLRFLAIIFKVATLYSPLKVFAPISGLGCVMAVGYSAYTLGMMGRFTNMSALLFVFSLLAFLIGLLSEQITVLMYKGSGTGGK